MGSYRFTAHARLDPSDALFLWTDLDRVTEWMEGVTAAGDATGREGRPAFTLPGKRLPLVTAPGSRYTLWYGRRRVRHEVLALDERGRTAHRTRLEGTLRRGETLVIFDQESGGSTVTMVVRAEGVLPRLAARLLATGTYRGSFRSQLRAFERLADREHWASLII